MVPVTSAPGFRAPVVMLAARFKSSDVGGVNVRNENVRSGWIVTTVGVNKPGSRSTVRALNSFAKSMALTPFAPVSYTHLTLPTNREV